MIQKAEEYVWILSNQILVSTMLYLEEALKREVEFKLILPINVIPPKDAFEQMSSPVFLEAAKSGKIENKFLEKTDVLICLSEKEVSALGFLNADGKMDYQGFHAKVELPRKRTKALYLHY